jgi:hypothetical protein
MLTGDSVGLFIIEAQLINFDQLISPLINHTFLFTVCIVKIAHFLSWYNFLFHLSKWHPLTLLLVLLILYHLAHLLSTSCEDPFWPMDSPKAF